MYNDDANLSCYNSDVNVIQTNLEYDMPKIQRYCVNNKMVINTSNLCLFVPCKKCAHLTQTTLDLDGHMT